MGKNPAFQFYPGDWRRDTQVQMASMETRGVWFEMLCCMWDAPDRGKLSGPPELLCRLLGCERDVLDRSIKEIDLLKIGNVTNGHNEITITNRRMSREQKVRNDARLRKQRQRSKPTSHKDVTPPSSSSSSSSGQKQCPQQQIVDLWHEHLPTLPKIKIWDETRQATLRARWNEDESRQSLDWWVRFFQFISKSPFLMGETESTDGRKAFHATLPWVIKKANIIKIIEGNYDA